MSITNDIVFTTIYDKRDNFDFEIVNFPIYIVMFLFLYLKEYMFLNSPDLLEHLARLHTFAPLLTFILTLAINF